MQRSPEELDSREPEALPSWAVTGPPPRGHPQRIGLAGVGGGSLLA